MKRTWLNAPSCASSNVALNSAELNRKIVLMNQSM
jgi:hypothetical protein